MSFINSSGLDDLARRLADSVPESEWQETENKARAVLRAAEQVQDGLDSDF